MKLYTRARPLKAFQLRPGDQLAVSKRRAGVILNSETAFMDHDLDNRITWSVVHAAFEVGIDQAAAAFPMWRVQHTLGENDQPAATTVIVREVIELDPWTYVKAAE